MNTNVPKFTQQSHCWQMLHEAKKVKQRHFSPQTQCYKQGYILKWIYFTDKVDDFSFLVI